MAVKRSRKRRASKNLHEIAKLSAEEIDALLNPKEEVEEPVGRDRNFVSLTGPRNVEFANAFGVSLSFGVSIQLETAVTPILNRLGRRKFDPVECQDDVQFISIFFKDHKNRLAAAFQISKEVQVAKVDSKSNVTGYYAENFDDSSRGEDKDFLNSLQSASVLMGKRLKPVTDSGNQSLQDYEVLESDMSIIDIQLGVRGRYYFARVWTSVSDALLTELNGDTKNIVGDC